MCFPAVCKRLNLTLRFPSLAEQQQYVPGAGYGQEIRFAVVMYGGVSLNGLASQNWTRP
jgi:hypothetical protein